MKDKSILYYAGAWVLLILYGTTLYWAIQFGKSLFAGILITFVFALLTGAIIWKIQQNLRQFKQQQAMGQLQLQAQLSLLQTQAQPQFWQAILQQIRKMAYPVSDPLIEFTNKLLDLNQPLINHYTHNDIGLQEEIAYLQCYIAVMQQIKQPLFVEFNINGDATGKRIPFLLLLPFVENAFRQGITHDAQRPVRINLKTTDNRFTFSISCKTAKVPDGSWLTALRHRLDHAYPNQYELLVSANGQTYKATLNMTLHES